jgi:hypothetical protein
MSLQISVALPPLLVMAIVIAVLIFAILWKKGKTVEAMLVLNALLQTIIILVLLFGL